MKKITSIILTLIISIFMLTACSNSSNVTVYAPDGAPALALSSLIKSDVKNVKVSLTSADKISSVVTGKNKKADVCILPINLASKLIGNGNDYKMLGTITHGNFYFLSTNEISVTKQNASVLIGKTVGVMQLNNVPGLTLKYSLNALQVPFVTIQDGAQKQADKVNLMAINKIETARTDIDVFLIPSPQADLKVKTTNLKFVGDLGSLYSENGFPQAIIVAKNSVIDANLPIVKQIVDNIKTVNDFLKEENKQEICALVHSKLENGLTPVFNENNLTSESIENSKIKFISAKNSKESVDTFIKNLKSVEPASVLDFNENFFYLGDL
ncbi:MAG: hypothetical protein J6R29_01165 [Clostridia bacterium]|nr:hypothetical protein [Clostridia bacterium]